jgi:uncharacterized membrane protein YdbT with pleckstrin-like domain
MRGRERTYNTTPQKGGYIEESLGSGEAVCAIAQFHWWYTFKAWVWMFVGLIVIGFWIWLYLIIKKKTTEVGVTSHRFVMKTGLIVRHSYEIALQNIEGVQVIQGVWGRLLNYGHLRIEGTGVDAIEIPDIADPVGFRAAIETAKDMQLKELKAK